MRGDLLFTAVSPSTQSTRITHLRTDWQTADSPPILMKSKSPWRCVLSLFVVWSVDNAGAVWTAQWHRMMSWSFSQGLGPVCFYPKGISQ